MPGRGVARLAGVLAVLAALALAPVSDARYLQAGYDAARTGHSPDVGPAWPDLALRMEFDGGMPYGSPPLLVDGVVYVATTDATVVDDGSTTLHRVDLRTGASRPHVVLAGYATAHVSDGETYYVAVYDAERDALEIAAFDLAAGTEAWRRPVDFRPRPDHDGLFCSQGAVAERRLYFTCLEAVETPLDERDRLPGTLPGDIPRWRSFLLTLDTRGGDVRTWEKTAAEETAHCGPAPSALAPLEASTRYGTFFTALAVNGPYVHVASVEGVNCEGVAEAFVWTVRADDLAYVSHRSSETPYTDAGQWGPVTGGADAQFPNAGIPTGDGVFAFMRLGREILAVNPAQDSVAWNLTVGERDDNRLRVGSGFAFDGRNLYATSVQTLYRIDTETLEAKATTLAPRPEHWSPSVLVLAGGVVYGRAQSDAADATTNVFYAFDAATLEERWRHELPVVEVTVTDTAQIIPVEYDFAVGEGVLVLFSDAGVLTVLGRTPLSPTAAPDVEDTHPAPGAEVVVDLSASAGGPGAVATEYRAHWGDGTATEWTTEPVFRHAYTEAGDRAARFEVRDSDGRTASEAVVFHVGAPRPNLVSKAFSPENQETTFFALGLALTGAGAAFGLARRKRRRGLLKRELAAVEAAYARTRDRPLACEAALAERRARANGLLLDGKLDEAQAAVLGRRVDELTRTLRTHELGELLDRLPHRLARAVQEMLADGRVTGFERDAFLALLERDDLLDAATKRRAAAVIEAWRTRDEGGRA